MWSCSKIGGKLTVIVRKNFRLGRFVGKKRRGWEQWKTPPPYPGISTFNFWKKRRRASKFLNPLRKEKIFALIFLGERLETTFLYKQLHFEFDSLAESLKNLKKWTFKRIIWVILYFFEKIYFLIFSYKTSKYIERERELKSRSSYVTTSDGCYCIWIFLYYDVHRHIEIRHWSVSICKQTPKSIWQLQISRFCSYATAAVSVRT